MIKAHSAVSEATLTMRKIRLRVLFLPACVMAFSSSHIGNAKAINPHNAESRTENIRTLMAGIQSLIHIFSNVSNRSHDSPGKMDC